MRKGQRGLGVGGFLRCRFVRLGVLRLSNVLTYNPSVHTFQKDEVEPNSGEGIRVTTDLSRR